MLFGWFTKHLWCSLVGVPSSCGVLTRFTKNLWCFPQGFTKHLLCFCSVYQAPVVPFARFYQAPVVLFARFTKHLWCFPHRFTKHLWCSLLGLPSTCGAFLTGLPVYLLVTSISHREGHRETDQLNFCWFQNLFLLFSLD